MSIRAAIYLRISLDRDGTEQGVVRQLEDALDIVAQRGWTIAGEPYQDNSISASKRDVHRPAYDRMVNDYAAGKFDAIVCYDLDRLTRQPRQLEDWIEAAEERGLVIITTNGEADLSTDGGRMYARVKAAVARSEIERKGARQRRANTQRRDQGRPAPSRRRFGYESDGVTPRHGEAEVARSVFEAFAGGESIRAIARDLYERGVDPAPGKVWSTSRLRKMLSNPAYGGELSWEGETRPAPGITPLVPTSLAQEVRAILADDSRRKFHRGAGRQYLASGLALCGGTLADGSVCENPLTARGGYYVCRSTAVEKAAVELASGERERRHIGIAIPALDAHIREHIALALLTTSPAALRGDDAPAVAPLMARLEKLEAATMATMADRDDGLVSPHAARVRLLSIRQEREAVEAALDASRASRNQSETLATFAQDVIPGGHAVYALADRVEASIPLVVVNVMARGLDRERDLLQQLITVSVAPGRGLARVHVHHRVADHLNGPTPFRVQGG